MEILIFAKIQNFMLKARTLSLEPRTSVWENYFLIWNHTAQKMKFSNKDFFSKCDQISSLLWIWSHLLKQSLMEKSVRCSTLRFVKMQSFMQKEKNKCLNEITWIGYFQFEIWKSYCDIWNQYKKFRVLFFWNSGSRFRYTL